MFYVKGLSANSKALDKCKGLLHFCFLPHSWSLGHQAFEARVGTREISHLGYLEEELASLDS